MRGDRPDIGLSQNIGFKFTPHARGSTCPWPKCRQAADVYPACAGIDRDFSSAVDVFLRLPRMRGDRPSLPSPLKGGLEFTPHARGSTLMDDKIREEVHVYPACAGIDLGKPICCTLSGSLPRMRGDRPCRLGHGSSGRRFTPHARGSTRIFRWYKSLPIVYPACAGIDRQGPL